MHEKQTWERDNGDRTRPATTQTWLFFLPNQWDFHVIFSSPTEVGQVGRWRHPPKDPTHRHWNRWHQNCGAAAQLIIRRSTPPTHPFSSSHGEINNIARKRNEEVELEAGKAAFGSVVQEESWISLHGLKRGSLLKRLKVQLVAWTFLSFSSIYGCSVHS